MSACKHEGYEVECKGDVRRTKYGMLCGCHAYRAFLKERCGYEVEPDGYGVENENEGMMFSEQEEDKTERANI